MKRVWTTPDPPLFVAAFIATLLGALMIFDAGYARSLAQGDGAIPREFKQQILTIGGALFVGWLVSLVPTVTLKKLAFPLFGLTILGLFAVEWKGITMNGAKRWLDVGFQIQPAEFVKVAAVVFLAAVLSYRKPWKDPKPSRDWAEWLDRVGVPKFVRALPFLLVLFAAVMIEREPDLGTAGVVVGVALAMMVYGGVTWKSILALVAIGSVGIFAMIKAEPYRLDRITNHTQRWQPDHIEDTGYQTTQSETAMASGGWTGVGIGAGRAKHMLPAATTDFILATIGEELGLLGVLGVLGLLGWITFRLAWLANRASSTFGKLVLAGVATWIGIQTCTNVMMANGFLPAIGIPLPFISSGGSSLLALWLAIGVSQSAIREKKTRLATIEAESVPTREPARPKVGEREPIGAERGVAYVD